MASHPSSDTLAAFRRQTLPPSELHRISEHVATCLFCAREAGQATVVRPQSTWTGVARNPTDADHLTPEQATALAEGRLDPGMRLLAIEHVAWCASCAAEVQRRTAARDAAIAGGSRANGAGRAPAWSPPAYRAPLVSPGFARTLTVLAAGVATACGGAATVYFASVQPLRSAMDRQWAMVSAMQASHRTEAETRAALELRLAELEDLKATSLQLQKVAENGQAREAELQRKLAALQAASQDSGTTATLQDVNLKRPEALAALGGSAKPSGRGLQPASPVATAIRSNTPQFLWKPAPGIGAYQVVVYDAQHREVARSGGVTTNHWRAPRPLPRGQEYTWEVNPAGRIPSEASQVPGAAARFRILDLENAAKLARTVDAGHLSQAARYAGAGLLDEAERELLPIIQDQPDRDAALAQRARRLLNQVRSWRR